MATYFSAPGATFGVEVSRPICPVPMPAPKQAKITSRRHRLCHASECIFYSCGRGSRGNYEQDQCRRTGVQDRSAFQNNQAQVNASNNRGESGTPITTGVVAVVTLSAGGRKHSGGVAVPAGSSSMINAIASFAAASRMGAIEICWRPGSGAVALKAVGSERPCMEGRVCMTTCAGGWQSGKFSPGMAAQAGQGGMCTSQWEEFVMVEVGREPSRRSMAETAIGAELALMGIVLGMAGIAIRGSTLEGQISMTGSTYSLGMFTDQREYGLVVIEGGRFPRICRMAGSAGCTELAAVRIVLCMAGVAVCRRVFKYQVGVTGGTCRLGMLPQQREGGLAVIEGGRLPGLRRVASSTGRPQLTGVRIILPVA